MKSPKVAIIQNKLHKGGRLGVLVYIIKALNKLKITPDLITLQSQIEPEAIYQNYGINIDFNLLEISLNFPMPYKANVVYYNLLLKLLNPRYDLFINSSNSSIFLPKKIKILSYYHYPQKDRIFSNKKSIHFPNGNDISCLSIEGLTDLFLRPFYKKDKLNRPLETILANSKFTKKAIKTNYPETIDKNIKVLYPPVKIPAQLPDLTKKDFSVVVSSGRFSPIKRQFEQIKIAESLPNLKFKIIGFKKKNCSYFEKCNDYIIKNRITNVELVPNAAFEKLNEIYSKAGFFLHSTRNEPFGISTVQAITKGCIPIVHNSGGQKEIVGSADLRYGSIIDAVEKFKDIRKKDKIELEKINTLLFSNLKTISEKYFQKKITTILENILDL